MTDNKEIMMFSNSDAFELAQRVAKVFAASQMVPKQFQGDISNCMIALNIANRLKADPFAVMQSMYVVQGRPAFSASFMIAMVNASHRFTPLRFEYVGEPDTDEFGCRVIATDLETGHDCIGSTVTIGLAKAEGWYNKNGSKWKTMPEQMLAYRSAAFWARIYASDLLCGITHTDDELRDASKPVSVKVTKINNALNEFTKQLESKESSVPWLPLPEPKTERDYIEHMWIKAVEKWGDDHQNRLKDLCDYHGIDLSCIKKEQAEYLIKEMEKQLPETKTDPKTKQEYIELMWTTAVETWGPDHQKKLRNFCDYNGIDISCIKKEQAKYLISEMKELVR
jgi:hypothetical protein